MLAPDEFTTGTFASAPVGSLILPRNEHEVAAIVGVVDEAPTVVILSGQYQFHYFPTAGSTNWSGLIIPDVRIEIDETTAFDPGYGGRALGLLLRSGTSLGVYSKTEKSFGRSRLVPLISNLPAIEDSGVGFTKWQVVLGEGQNKRVLHRAVVQVADQ